MYEFCCRYSKASFGTDSALAEEPVYLQSQQLSQKKKSPDDPMEILKIRCVLGYGRAGRTGQPPPSTEILSLATFR